MKLKGQKPLKIVIKAASKAKNKLDWGQVVEGFKFYLCHDGQLDVLASTAKFTAAFAGAQGGKTALVPHWLWKQMQRHVGTEPFRALIVSPTVPMRKQSQIVEHIENFFGGTELEGKHNKNDSVYKFPNGAELLLRTSENPVNLDAGVYHACVIDEAAKVSKEAWDRIKVRASSQNAPILAVSTPDVASAIYDEFTEQTKPAGEGKRVSDDGRYFMRVWANIDRPGYSLEAYEEAKRTMSRAMFDRMFRGVFTRFEGLVYEAFGDPKDPKFPVIKTPARLPSPAICTIGGIDFGFTTDPAAVVLAAVGEDGVVYVVDEIYQTGLNNDQLAERVTKLKRQWEVDANYKFADLLRTGTTQFFCDTEDPKAIQTLRQYGINATGKRVRDITPSIATVNAMFMAGRLVIFDRCVNLIGELKAYQWEQGRGGEYKDTPKGKDDHLCDALRYMVGSYMLGKKITPIDLTTSLTADDIERQSLEAADRLGIHVEARRNRQAKEEEEAYARWFNHLAWCEDE